MVSTRTAAIVAVSVVMVVFTAQAYGESAELAEWAKPIHDNIKNIASKLRSSSNSEIVESAKSQFLDFVDKFKGNVATFNTNVQAKADASDAVKEAVKSFKAKVENYKVPTIESDANKVADKYEGAAKFILSEGHEIGVKAKGSEASENYIKEFGKKQIDDLTAIIQSVANKVDGKSA
ncbi:uncharacterized protein LOC126837866 [Adelges cooleyi]|uniref:uncharacterized protein LOC126837866 n=1 Tax=Adelges cooleyi TaxID=133065 RepID=UPI00217F644B|nr:uncharacterized protein LOC126837866 [Adelges cooleyi]